MKWEGEHKRKKEEVKRRAKVRRRRRRTGIWRNEWRKCINLNKQVYFLLSKHVLGTQCFCL